VENPISYPLLVFVASLILLWIAARIGAAVRKKRPQMDEEAYHDLVVVLGATLTLLGLIIGFTFSMAVTRYDLRKQREAEEANAIGTEYLRASLLPAADAARTRALLQHFLDQRIRYYETPVWRQLEPGSAEATQLQREMWSAVLSPATAQPTPLSALVVSGMNDVLNAKDYTEAAWRNRIPSAAWIFVLGIALFCNLVVGYVAHGKSSISYVVLPIALAISLFLLSDIYSPRGGIIHVHPENLRALADSLQSK